MRGNSIARKHGLAAVKRTPLARERGLAAVLAILIVALAASTATYLLWEQTVVVRQVENLDARAQIREIARAAVSWAAAILNQDDRTTDNLNEAWAQPLPPIDVEQATLQGGITDEQSKFNLNNLGAPTAQSPSTSGNTTANLNDTNVLRFRTLLSRLSLDPGLCDALIDWLDADSNVTAPGGAEDSYYQSLTPPYRTANTALSSVGELRLVKGFTPDVVDRLSPYVTALPAQNLKLNVNTMTADQIAVLIPEVSPGAVIEARKRTPFASAGDFTKLVGGNQNSSHVLDIIDTKSNYFAARAHVTQGRTTMTYRAILQRGTTGWPQTLSFTEEPM